MIDIEERAVRMRVLRELRIAGIDPYPAHVSRTHSAADAVAAYEPTIADDLQPTVTVAGRVIRLRDIGKLIFLDLQDATGKVQVACRQDLLGHDQYTLLASIHPGDFLGVTGQMFSTRRGEITVRATILRLLTKALRPLPDKYHGLVDKELRYRKRYLDLITNHDSFERLMLRSRMVSIIRRLLEERGFVEVETPVLQPLYGGAHARPFVTHFNALDEDLFLRIALELYHKRLLIGGFDKLFEIGRVFRNEGLSRKHNPEFTMLELYWAYADYTDIMTLVEWLVSTVATALFGNAVIDHHGTQIDLTPPWPRHTLREAILEYSGIDIASYPSETTRSGDSAQAGDETLLAAARQLGLALPDGTSRGKVVDELLSTYVEPRLIAPTFLYDYPTELSPLAKTKPDDPSVVERFEAFAGGVELANAFSELNDPQEQRLRFQAQAEDHAAGDLEAHTFDEDFLEALEYGMPPAGGLGIGIDRLAMFLSGAESIKDVILFPQMRRTSPGFDSQDQ